MATIGKAARRQQAEADRARQKAQRRHARDVTEINHLIETTGWAVCVADSNGPASLAPHFAYTIGRTLKGQPELCTWVNDRANGPTILNLAGGVLERNQHPVAAGEVLTVPGVGAWATVAVPPHMYGHLAYARERYTFLRAVLLKRVA